MKNNDQVVSKYKGVSLPLFGVHPHRQMFQKLFFTNKRMYVVIFFTFSFYKFFLSVQASLKITYSAFTNILLRQIFIQLTTLKKLI